MAYLPESLTNETAIPRGFHQDFQEQVRVVNEKWQRHYPLIKYFCLKKVVTPVGQAVDTPIGATPNTVFDPLWGESIDKDAMVGGAYIQPHVSGVSGVDATDPPQYEPAVDIHAQIRRDAKERELKRLGFDEVRDILVTIPTSLLDAAGITVQQGDRLIWDNDLYEVLQKQRTGYWKNTNLRLYVVMNCEHARMGS
mgnify:CR=1 FL=1